MRREPAAQTAPVLAIGVDGCPAGWFFVELQPSGITRCGVVRTLQELVRDAREPARVYVDMPIGLPDGPSGRECDHLARRELGPRGSSVFPAPARAVLDAVDYESAKRHSLRTTGRSLSKQAWAIVPKCREVDRLLRDDAKARRIVREVHPELCFWALAGGRPMQHGKKHDLGIQERIAVLRRIHPSAAGEAAAMLERRPRGVARDDVVDAMAAAVTATADDAIRTLPPRPPRDACGLPMEMVYVHRDSVIHERQDQPDGHDMRPEYDLREGSGASTTIGAGRANVVLLEPDVARWFRDSATVNEALRRYPSDHGVPPTPRKPAS